MKLIDRQYLATPFYGARKIAAWLKSQSHQVNRKRVRRLMQLMGLKAIARSLNADGISLRTGKKWGATSIEKILHNEAYTGTMIWGKRTKNPSQIINGTVLLRTDDAWPALVDRATFTQSQARLASRAPQVIHLGR